MSGWDRLCTCGHIMRQHHMDWDREDFGIKPDCFYQGCGCMEFDLVAPKVRKPPKIVQINPVVTLVERHSKDKRHDCGCHMNCTTLPHECDKPCKWTDCLTVDEHKQLAKDIDEELRP